MPENEPATKQDILDARAKLIEAMRDMQTEVLRAFIERGEAPPTPRH